MKNTMNLPTYEKHFSGGLHATISATINAPQQRLMKIYSDFNNWHKLFPATITGAHLVKTENGIQTVEVDHRKPGKVINILRFLTANEIELEGFKPIYNTIFLNRFK